jgi:hypothetical protein
MFDHNPVNHGVGMTAGLGLLFAQAVADPQVLDASMSTLAQLTALAAAVGTAGFGLATLIRTMVDAYLKIRYPNSPRVESAKP